MTSIAERIHEEAKSLPENLGAEVLDFIGYLRSRHLVNGELASQSDLVGPSLGRQTSPELTLRNALTPGWRPSRRFRSTIRTYSVLLLDQQFTTSNDAGRAATTPVCPAPVLQARTHQSRQA